MRSEETWQPWMLAEYGIQPWQVRNYTNSQVRGMRAWMERERGDD